MHVPLATGVRRRVDQYIFSSVVQGFDFNSSPPTLHIGAQRNLTCLLRICWLSGSPIVLWRVDYKP